MDSLIRRCLAMTIGGAAVALVLLAAGVPGATLLAFAPSSSASVRTSSWVMARGTVPRLVRTSTALLRSTASDE